MFQTAKAAKLSAAPVNASLLLHSAGILLLCLVSRPGPRSQRPREQVTLLAPSPEIPARPTSKAVPKPALHLAALPIQRRRHFEAPPQVPEPLLKSAIDLPPMPVLDLARAPLPGLAPRLPAFAPLARPAIVKAAGFPSADSAAADVSPRLQTAIGGFEAASTEAAAVQPTGVPQGRGVAVVSGFTQERAAPAVIPSRLTPHNVAGFGDAATEATATPRGRGLAVVSGFTQEHSARPATPARPIAHDAAEFGDASVAAPSARVAAASASASSVIASAEILDKPLPSYTEEARRLNIEGEVVLEVLFQSTGQAKVLRIVHGLGHGLDESAMAAARQIHFRPAHRGGVAVDSSAMVHIVFQLAY